MNEKQKTSANRRRTRAEIQQLVAEFVGSGMRRTEFCRSRGLSFGTLDRHLKKQRWKRKNRRASSAGRLVPVELAARNCLRLFLAWSGSCLARRISACARVAANKQW